MPEIMRLAFKYKLRPNRKQEQAMRNFSGCCRFAYNALLAQEKEEYQEYLEELESRLCCGEALSKDEAKALCVKPKLNQYTFNYALKKLKEEYPFLKECCHSRTKHLKKGRAFLDGPANEPHKRSAARARRSLQQQLYCCLAVGIISL